MRTECPLELPTRLLDWPRKWPIKVQFEELRRYTRETIDEYKRLLERANDRIERVERERVAKEAELHAKIEGLSSRLDALSEGALHAAISTYGS